VTTVGTNTTTVNIQPSNPPPTQCAQWQFLAEPGQEARVKVVNYCQKVFSGPGYWNNGCVVCSFSDMSYNVPGLSLPTNITCPATVKRARFLQTPTTTTANITNDVPTYLTVCPIAHPICTTDIAASGKVFADYFNQMVNDLKTAALFKSTIGVDNIRLNTTQPILTVIDTVIPDITKVSVTLTDSQATGAVSWTATYSSPLQCYWMISDTTTTPSFTAIQSCTDPSRCGKSKVGPAQTSMGPSVPKPFAGGASYNIFMACTNDIPMAQKISSVRSVASFNVPSVTPAPISPGFVVAAGYINYSLLAILILLSLII